MTGLAAASMQPGFALVFVSLSMFSLFFALAGKWTLITAVTPQSYCASASAIQNFGGYLGCTLSPIATGYVLDATGSFVVALGIGAAFTGFAAAVFLFGVRNRIRAEDLDPSLRSRAA
jgi:cyanate permease